MTEYRIGVDVGGTKTEMCLLAVTPSSSRSHEYEVLVRERIPTARTGTLEAFLLTLNELFEMVLGSKQLGSLKVSKKEIKSIGIGLPGSINPVSQVMSQGSVSFFKEINLPQVFKKALAFDGRIVFDNDANCFALAEHYLGAGKKWAEANSVPLSELCLVGVILGTGVGGGVVVHGQLIRGARGGAGEAGHITMVESGRPCYCGKFGCVEQYLAGPAFEYSYASKASILNPLPASKIFKQATEGDLLSLSVIDDYRAQLASFLSNLCNMVDPHVIVLGGGMSNQSAIYEGIAERLSHACFLTSDPPPVLKNECGDSAGVFGAAMLPLWISGGQG